MIEFNVNRYVWVQLTDEGRRIHRENHDDLEQSIPGRLPEYRAPKEDDDGWSKWQLWCLMQDFGSHIRMGGPNPFNTNIRLEQQS